MKFMSPFQKLPKIQKIFKKSLQKIPQKLPKSTQKMRHTKLKKLLTQEAKNITCAQTLTQTTQTHTDIKRQIKKTQRLELYTMVSFVNLSLMFFFILYVISNQNWKLSFFSLQTGGRHQMRRNQPKLTIQTKQTSNQQKT